MKARGFEQEVMDLIDDAWEEYDLATAIGDEAMAEFWKGEALDLIEEYFSENPVKLVQ